ncbi:hypothetical protein [Mycobacteroides abscessus]|uniref:hypothetical protein n=1 Tax=Mycobacteroides abscessus TaxID=36809 RepID=UPI000D3E0C24|nr:hypothetical protein [Mycobacteroides abscessus]PVB19708.1 hypothetical protein DDJ40_08065 [Mycobacteroides abscessus]RIU40309.1 hypothetical protein D2E83_11075 [Mycobacteroides abscessus]
MSKLINIENRWVDPNKVISIWHPEEDYSRIMFSVDQGSWSQQFEIESDPEGWTIDILAEAVNEARS